MKTENSMHLGLNIVLICFRMYLKSDLIFNCLLYEFYQKISQFYNCITEKLMKLNSMIILMNNTINKSL